LTTIYNGMPASDLTTANWYKSPASSPQGNCVELARLPGEQIAMRNSRHPNGPTLIFTTDQIQDLIDNLKSGAFDQLILHPKDEDQATPTARPTVLAAGDGRSLPKSAGVWSATLPRVPRPADRE
jgi:hypothetical protein